MDNLQNKKLANLLFGDVTLTKDDLEKKFPRRNKDLVVTRFAPSPTGFLHIGGVYTALIDRKIATQNNGVFFLRIEDTDKKREVPNSKEIIVNIFNRLGIKIDEGVTGKETQKGSYGSYIQSERVEIYHVLAKYLVEKGYAYPCFCTEDELNQIREEQTALKVSPGYYGKWAKYRDCDYETVAKLINEGKPYVLRFRVPENSKERVGINDLIKGEIEMDNNQNDFVLLKEDGIPTYHFAHACDDHLMGTTHLFRGDEWVSSLPIHLQLFEALEYPLPRFGHVAPIMKLDGESRRKLSKRKDPESSAEYYLQEGYPIRALYVYLYTLINSNFEEWYLNNQDADLDDFTFTYEAMSTTGALYDLDKLKNISSEIIYKLKPEENAKNCLEWAKEFDNRAYNLMAGNPDLLQRLFETQGPNSKENRKDMSHYSEFMDIFGLFYNDIFDNDGIDYTKDLLENVKPEELNFVIDTLITHFTNVKNGSEETLKNVSDALGYTNKKKYEKNPENYRGVIFQFYHLIRIALTHKTQGIGLDDIIECLGYDEVIRRLNKLKGRN